MPDNKNNHSEIVYSERELRQMREDDLFQERYWNDECYIDSKLEVPKSQTVKSYVYGADLKIDLIVDELKRIKQQKEERK